VLLIVADDPNVLVEVRNVAHAAGFTVHQASVGADALRRLDTIKPAGIILETGLPGIDGFAVCRKLRTHHRTRSAPVVLILPQLQPDLVLQASQCGATASVCRPLPMDELMAHFSHLQGLGGASCA
jgi:DNA-binding response OmpR family regulator